MSPIHSQGAAQLEATALVRPSAYSAAVLMYLLLLPRADRQEPLPIFRCPGLPGIS